jgi:anaerobic ribonucleoside-triphosphate reductase activating protein
MRIFNINYNDPVNSVTGFTLSIWFQFCEHRCNGCYSPQTWGDGGYEITDIELKDVILNSKWNNVSLIGGDPFHLYNREEVVKLIEWIKLNTNKTLYVWTGYLKEDVDKWVDCKYIDYLIDGKFEKDKLDLRLLLRSSINQKIYKNGNLYLDK